MQSTIPLYGFGGGSGGTGAVLTVAAPAGATVTVSKDGKSKTKVADSDGSAVFQGLSTGNWLLSITDGTQTAQKTVTITADYATAITFFSAAIHVTYPAGATCTATDGVTTLTAPDTGGSWDCVVPNTGTWTVAAEGYPYPSTVEISKNGQAEDVDLTRVYLFKDGNQYEDITGGWTNSGYQYSASNAESYSPVTIENNQLLFNKGGGTGEKINITGYKTLKCVLVDKWSGDVSFGVGENKYTYIGAQAAYITFSSPGTYSLDISSVTDGNYYVKFRIAKHVSEVWLEA